MRVLKAIFRFLGSRFFWTAVGLLVLSLLIWFYGPIVAIGEARPLEGQLSRIVVIGAIWLSWLIVNLVRQLRALKANRLFVTELTQPAAEERHAPGEENVAAVREKFSSILDQMKRSKVGGRRFLREMPWYVFIGPPATGKTTALRQSGLHFPINLSDDLKGVGGTRNCDWFFTEDAVLIDTAGRYVEQQSDPEADAAEWSGFLDLLKKHRGSRALNGVIATVSVEELAEDQAEIRAHGREIRKRLAELRETLGARLPVYLMITKADLVPGFTAFFDDLATSDREQVWGATFEPGERIDGVVIEREVKALVGQLEARLPGRIAEELPLAQRAEIFRFPSQLEALIPPLKTLIDAAFRESQYEESPWLRGFYLTSATQEGSPIDMMIGGLAARFGLSAPPPERRAGHEPRSFFLRDLLSKVIFAEAGLGVVDPRVEERRRWIWRGTLAGTALVGVLACLLFIFSYLRYSGVIEDQARQFTTLAARLANVAARQAPTDPLDLPLALDAATEVQAAATAADTGLLTVLGPSAEAELDEARRMAYQRTLRNVLEPRMVALLEATLWREIRDPDYLLGALKSYQMMTGLAPYDAGFVADWWQTALPPRAPIDPFPSETARDHELAALQRMKTEEDRIAPDRELVATALETICQIPLSVRAYRALLDEFAVQSLPEWVPAEHAGPNGPRVLTRLSERTLRVGLPGAFTYDGFYNAVLPLVPEIAAEAALDRAVFAGGCSDSAQISPEALQDDMLKLYDEDYIARWDGFLRDVRLAPIETLTEARENLKDLSSSDSALKRLLTAIVAETNLTRTGEAAAGGGNEAAKKGILKIAQKKLGKIGKLAKKSSKFVRADGGGPEPAPPGAPVAEHFAPIRAAVEEVDGQPPALDDAVAALSALYKELQTVAASPDPESALLARGGLPQLTGAIANEAAALPEPLDAWLTGLAGDAFSVTREAVIDQLNARWRADVEPFCVAATRGRYPFEQASAIDVNIADFARLFGPGGLVDSYINDQLLPYVDTTARPWTWRTDFGLDPALLVPFEKARSIRDALFPGGAGPSIGFQLEPVDLSASAARVTLNVDGQILTYFNAAPRPVQMTWPGPDGTNLVSLSFAPVDGSSEVITSEVGSWALLRMIRNGRMTPTELPEVFRLGLAAGGHSAEFTMRANSVENPLDLTMFSGFSCPNGL